MFVIWRECWLTWPECRWHLVPARLHSLPHGQDLPVVSLMWVLPATRPHTACLALINVTGASLKMFLLLFIVGHSLQHLQFQARQIVSLTLPGWWWPTRPAKKLQDLFLLIQSPVRARTRPPPGDGQDPSERGQPTGEDRGHSGTAGH